MACGIPPHLPQSEKILKKSVKLVIYTAILLYGINAAFTGCRTLERGVNMARRRSASKARRGRGNKAHSEEHVYGVAVPEGLHEAIENERDNLSKAESVLGCLAISMEYESDSVSGPYYPDVAQLAREMVRQSINGLDSLVLQQRLLRNKVKESPPDLSFAEGYVGLRTWAAELRLA